MGKTGDEERERGGGRDDDEVEVKDGERKRGKVGEDE